ncbi:Death-inducer obliterator 1 [Frankliniella fusca]|uniref:Death-inducer obliterator 1 n=1 Tax=Frankliniella fusca TaxID=407009 RepID=A0AAE1LTZ6_9NEOP|nr:Death-inducer obliterator 1 [Frankliniella fusca]
METLYCVCRQPYDGRQMICCDKCQLWFHAKCMQLTSTQIYSHKTSKWDWHCSVCHPLRGKFIRKGSTKATRTVSHSHDARQGKVAVQGVLAADDQSLVFNFGAGTVSKPSQRAPGTQSKISGSFQSNLTIASTALPPVSGVSVDSRLQTKSHDSKSLFCFGSGLTVAAIASTAHSVDSQSTFSLPVATPTKSISTPSTPTKVTGSSQNISLDLSTASPAAKVPSLIPKSPSIQSISRNLQFSFDEVGDTNQNTASPASGKSVSQKRRSRLSLSNQSCNRKLMPTPAIVPLVRDGLSPVGNKPTDLVTSLHKSEVNSADVLSDGSLSPDFKKPKKISSLKKLCDQNKAEPVPKKQERTETTVKSFSCAQCYSTFSRRDNLERHKKKCDGSVNTKKKSKCLFADCDQRFFKRGPLIQHLQHQHDQKIVPSKTFHFKSDKDFNLWKDGEEVKSFSYFSQNSGAKGNKVYLYCQHDGSAKAHRRQSEPDRKTSRKCRIGQIKAGNICIARMIVTKLDSGSLEVKYFATHSHPLSRHDFAHHPPTTEKNEEINSKIALGVPAVKIWESLQSTDYSRENRTNEKSNSGQRTVVITLSSIKQRIAKQRQMLRYHKEDSQSVLFLIHALRQEPYNPVVLFKPLGKDIEIGPPNLHCLASQMDELFMAGIQTESQRELMVEGAKHILIVDDTHNVTQYDNYKLLTVHTLDRNRRGVAVAHFISNCMKGDVIRYFVEAMRVRCDECGTPLIINCLITDDDSALHNGFELGMNAKIVHILCLWHIDRTFQDNIRDKVMKSYRDSIYIDLKVLILSKNKDEFSKLTSAFLKKYTSSATDFLTYLDKYYFYREEKWTMAYRTDLNHLNINTTSIAESFHNRLKKKRFPNKRMDDHINQLLDLEKMDYIRREREMILGYSVSPQENLVRHARGVAVSIM